MQISTTLFRLHADRCEHVQDDPVLFELRVAPESRLSDVFVRPRPQAKIGLMLVDQDPLELLMDRLRVHCTELSRSRDKPGERPGHGNLPQQGPHFRILRGLSPCSGDVAAANVRCAGQEAEMVARPFSGFIAGPREDLLPDSAPR